MSIVPYTGSNSLLNIREHKHLVKHARQEVFPFLCRQCRRLRLRIGGVRGVTPTWGFPELFRNGVRADGGGDVWVRVGVVGRGVECLAETGGERVGCEVVGRDVGDGALDGDEEAGVGCAFLGTGSEPCFGER